MGGFVPVWGVQAGGGEGGGERRFPGAFVWLKTPKRLFSGSLLGEAVRLGLAREARDVFRAARRALRAAARAGLAAFRPQELGNTAWAFAVAGGWRWV